MAKETSSEVKRVPNPTGKGGFADNPQNRGTSWKKEDTPRYKLEQMMLMSVEELNQIIGDKSRPFFERKIAKAIDSGEWKVIREMIHEIYGTPKQSMDVTSGGQALTPIVVEFVDGNKNTDSNRV